MPNENKTETLTRDTEYPNETNISFEPRRHVSICDIESVAIEMHGIALTTFKSIVTIECGEIFGF